MRRKFRAACREFRSQAALHNADCSKSARGCRREAPVRHRSPRSDLHITTPQVPARKILSASSYCCISSAALRLANTARAFQQDDGGFCDQARNRAHASFINALLRIIRLSSILGRLAQYFSKPLAFGSTVEPAPGDKRKDYSRPRAAHWSATTLPWRYRASASTTWRWLSWERVSDICADIIRIAAQLVQFA
jgi:hypothetical protein